MLDLLKIRDKNISENLINQFQNVNSFNYTIKQTGKKNKTLGETFAYSPKLCPYSRKIIEKNMSKYCLFLNDANRTDNTDRSKCDSDDEGNHEIPDEMEYKGNYTRKSSPFPLTARILTMMEKYKQIKESNNQKKKEASEKMFEECTFRPKLYPSAIRRTNSQKNIEAYANKEKIKPYDERTFEECTFVPNFFKRYCC